LGKKWLGYSMVGKKAFRIYHGWVIGPYCCFHSQL
jgi:hypothetical protein